MKPWQAIVVFGAIWAAAYLPHLGTEELRGEEVLSILPAIDMLKSGDWMVPRIAGEVHANKPPLTNWLIAGSFALTNSQSEWAARLPTILTVLLFGIFAIRFLTPRAGLTRALYLALIVITAVATIDLSRTAGLDSLYAVLFGVAYLLWACYRTEYRSLWKIWIPASGFLGLAMLAKGPALLLFWYLIVIAVLLHEKRLKELFHPAHFAGVALMLLIFLPWVWLNIHRIPETEKTVMAWSDELTKWLNFSDIDAGSWALHPLRILIGFLPWTIPLVYAAWKMKGQTYPDSMDSRRRALIRGTLWGVGLGALAVALLPNAVPRYVLPLTTPAAFVLIELFSALGTADRERFEGFTRKCMPVFFILVLLGCVAGAVYYRILDEYLAWSWIALSITLSVLCLVWIFRQGRDNSFFVQLPVLIALAVLATTSVVWPARSVHAIYPGYAAEVEKALPGRSGNLIVFVDDDWLTSHSEHLRMLYYFTRPFTAIGESGEFPDSEFLLLFRPADQEQLLKTLSGRKFLQNGSLDLGDLTVQIATVEGDTTLLSNPDKR